MTVQEFSDQFDVLYNNITSNQAPGLTEYEKSLFLTKAQDEIVKNYFLPQSNPKQAGFDDNQKRQADFSCLMQVANLDPSSTAGAHKYVCISSDTEVKEYPPGYYTFKKSSTQEGISPGTGTYSVNSFYGITVSGNAVTISPRPPFNSGSFIVAASDATVTKIDGRSTVYEYPNDVFLTINEVAETSAKVILQVVPLRYDDYMRLMSKPYKRPLKNQAWRLINNGTNAGGNAATKHVELIAGPGATIDSYTLRYIRKPMPIIVGDLDGLTINGYKQTNSELPEDAPETDGNCELDPILHEEILQRAVELAKVAWTATGQDNAQMVIQAGQRSE